MLVKQRHSKKGEPPFDYFGTFVDDLSSLSATRPDLLLRFLSRSKVSTVPAQCNAPLRPRIFRNKDAFWTAGAPNFGVDEKFWNSRTFNGSERFVNPFIARLKWWHTNADDVQRRGLRTAVEATTIPIRNLAGPDSPFLLSVLTASETVGDVGVFASTLVSTVVEFKWHAFGYSMFVDSMTQHIFTVGLVSICIVNHDPDWPIEPLKRPIWWLGCAWVVFCLSVRALKVR